MNYSKMTKKELIEVASEKFLFDFDYESNTKKELIEAIKNDDMSNLKIADTTNTKESETEDMKKEEIKEVKEVAVEEVEEMKNDSFDALKALLKELDVTILNETDRRITTNKVLFCKRAHNKVRAYLKLKTNDKLATEKNTQYKANILIDLNESHAIFTLRRLYH